MLAVMLGEDLDVATRADASWISYGPGGERGGGGQHWGCGLSLDGIDCWQC